jgi:hypothetical protein
MERDRQAGLRITLACRYYTEGLHGLISLRQDLTNKNYRHALRCVRPILEASLRSLFAVYASSNEQIEGNKFPKALRSMAISIEKRKPEFAPMFSHQLLKRKDGNGHTVEQLAYGWAHADVSLISPYSRPGALEQSCALWTAENFFAFAQATCFALDRDLSPKAPVAAKYF